jgi:hypothetical protein
MQKLSPSRVAGAAARVLVAAAALAIAFGGAIVFEAAAKTQLALIQAQSVQQLAEEERTAAFDSAARLLETSWARPLAWHAGALEALSWIRAQQGRLDEAAGAATRSVALDPIQPAAWARLAALADEGVREAGCNAAECLERSWRAAKMTDPPTACARLEIAYRNGLLSPRDERIEWTARSAFFHGRDTRQCFAFLPSGERVRAILLAEADRAKRAARRRR